MEKQRKGALSVLKGTLRIGGRERKREREGGREGGSRRENECISLYIYTYIFFM